MIADSNNVSDPSPSLFYERNSKDCHAILKIWNKRRRFGTKIIKPIFYQSFLLLTRYHGSDTETPVCWQWISLSTRAATELRFVLKSLRVMTLELPDLETFSFVSNISEKKMKDIFWNFIEILKYLEIRRNIWNIDIFRNILTAGSEQPRVLPVAAGAAARGVEWRGVVQLPGQHHPPPPAQDVPRGDTT